MKNLILSGGPYHPFAESSGLVAALLERDGITSEITDDVEGGLEDLSSFDLLTLNILRWRMLGERFDAERDEWASSLSAAGSASIEGHLAAGRGVLALHTAAICFDDWPGWLDVLGCRWDWNRSSHPPLRPSQVHVTSAAHPISEGLTDFEVDDEIYTDLTMHLEVEPLLTSPRRGVEQPVMWARSVGPGRVVYDALGHDARSLTHPVHATIIRRAASWAATRPEQGSAGCRDHV